MISFKTLITYRRLAKNQWLSRDQIKATQQHKLRRLIRHAYNTVPYYRTLFNRTGLVPNDITSVNDLTKIPITHKADLQGLTPQSFTSRAYRVQDLKVERTSGSTGQPFNVYFDPAFVVVRNLLFLRALTASGYRLGKRILLVTDLKNKGPSGPLPGWHYTSILNSPTQLRDDLDRVKPDFLYGCKTPLRLLAEYLHESGQSVHKPDKIITTGEGMDLTTARLIEDTFNAELFDVYGLTEMGIVGWECSVHNGYHMAEDTTIVEYLPVAEVEGVHRLVMTNLDLFAMPFIRFETGDLASPSEENACPCGRQFAKFERVQGRSVDIIQLRNGLKMTPYRLTCAMEEVMGLDQYQIIQTDLHRFTVKIHAQRYGGRRCEESIQSVMASVLGRNIDITIEQMDKDLFESGRKFSVVTSKI